MVEMAIVACIPFPALDAGAMNVDQDPDATQLVTESAWKKRKEDDVTKEMMDDAATSAAREVMAQMAGDNDMREKLLTDHLDSAAKKSVTEVVSELTNQFHGRMSYWESKMQKQCLDLEQKWENKIVQLQLGSVDSALSAAEHRIRMTIQTEVDKKWSEGVVKKDKIVLNKYET